MVEDAGKSVLSAFEKHCPGSDIGCATANDLLGTRSYPASVFSFP